MKRRLESYIESKSSSKKAKRDKGDKKKKKKKEKKEKKEKRDKKAAKKSKDKKEKKKKKKKKKKKNKKEEEEEDERKKSTKAKATLLPPLTVLMGNPPPQPFAPSSLIDPSDYYRMSSEFTVYLHFAHLTSLSDLETSRGKEMFEKDFIPLYNAGTLPDSFYNKEKHGVIREALQEGRKARSGWKNLA